LNDRCRREYASRRGRLAVPIDRLATTSLQRLRSRTGSLVWWRLADPPCGACAPRPPVRHPPVRAGWRHL